MKRSYFARLSTCLLLCLSPALLGHCGGATDSGLMGTETGNPPVVDSQKLRLVSGARGVELIGEPRAVSAGAEVRLDNQSSGGSAAVTAGADGSFRVELAGAAEDSYEVTVTHRGGTTSLPVTVAASEVLPPGSDATLLSCVQLDASLEATVSQAMAPFAAGCSTHNQCQVQGWDAGCYWQCHYSMVVAGQQAPALAAAEQSIAPLCSELEGRCQPLPAPANCNRRPPVPECFEGSCRELSPVGLSCAELEASIIRLATEIVAQVDRSCNTDADCTVTNVSGLSCGYHCGFSGPLAVSAVAPLRQSFGAIEDGLCGAFRGAGCSDTDPPPCSGFDTSSEAVCVNNRCITPEEP